MAWKPVQDKSAARHEFYLKISQLGDSDDLVQNPSGVGDSETTQAVTVSSSSSPGDSESMTTTKRVDNTSSGARSEFYTKIRQLDKEDVSPPGESVLDSHEVGTTLEYMPAYYDPRLFNKKGPAATVSLHSASSTTVVSTSQITSGGDSESTTSKQAEEKLNARTEFYLKISQLGLDDP